LNDKFDAQTVATELEVTETELAVEGFNIRLRMIDMGGQMGRFEETLKALDHLKVALLGDPSDAASLYSLDRALRKAGRLEEAKPIEQQLDELRAKSDHASTVALAASRLNDEGIALEKSGDLRAALAKYRAALDLDPIGTGFQLNYGLALCRLGRWEDATAELREVLRLDQNNQEATKALYIAIDQAKAQRGDARKHP